MRFHVCWKMDKDMPDELLNTAALNSEVQRLKQLRELFILDSAPEAVFDDIARLASEVCGVPIALMSLVDTERQWFKANVGLPGVNETPRDVAFCAHAIGSDALFEVQDATLDPRFSRNPLVTGAPDIRFYAGAPLILPGGERVGTLCVIDRTARQLSPQQAAMLRSLAAIASQTLVMRRDLINRSLAVRSAYEDALAAGEARYRAIVEEQAELVSLAHPDGTLAYVNPAYARHFGRSPEQMIGTQLLDHVEPADREAVRLLLQQVLHTGEASSGENRMVTGDGRERWVSWTNRVQVDAAGQAMLHSVGRDVSERRQAERALQDSQALLLRTGRVAGVGGWQMDLRTGALNWSDETRRIHEVGPEYVPMLETAIEFYAPEARLQIDAAVQRAMAEGLAWDLELPFFTARGRRIWVRAQGEAEFENGVPVRLVGAFQDVTERRQLQQRLAESERFIRLVTDSLPLRIAYVDADKRYRFVNLPHCEAFGLARDEIIGRTRSELTDGRGEAELSPRFDAVLSGVAQRFEFEEVVDGQARRLETQLIPDRSDDGEVRGFFSTSIDITERSAAEQALRELNAIVENSPDLIVQTNWRGEISYMNAATRRFIGVAPDQSLCGLNFSALNTDETNRLFAEVIVPAVKTSGVWIGDTTVYASGRRVVPVNHMVIAHREDGGRVARYSAVMRDISSDVETRKLSARQTATLRSVIEAIPAIVAVVGADQRYRLVNSGFERWIGAPRQRVVGQSLQEVLGQLDFERSRGWIDRALRGESVQFERDYPGRGGLRHLVVSYIPLWMDDGTVDGFVGVAQDITQHKQEEVRLLQLARRDPLTGLLNRAGFHEAMENCVQSGRAGAVALLYIDLDHFKPVNDVHGHPVGDQVLQLFAQRLVGLVRPTDAVARLGGDEFAILLAGVRTEANAQAVGDKVVAAAREPVEIGPLKLSIGASVGVAFGADGPSGWHELVAQADSRLYRAKQSGRGRVSGP